MIRALFLALLALAASPARAKDDLGVFEDWGAFRDPGVPRCYAISMAQNAAGEFQPFATIATWPRREVRGQVHFRLSRPLAAGRRIVLSVGSQRFELAGAQGDAWAADRRMDAAIVAAMRSSGSMSVSATDKRGRGFADRYSLAGAATAMDAATIGCAPSR